MQQAKGQYCSSATPPARPLPFVRSFDVFADSSVLESQLHLSTIRRSISSHPFLLSIEQFLPLVIGIFFPSAVMDGDRGKRGQNKRE